ncbi:MAG: hypothetical protein FWE54_01600 [Methanimicrococcus sp.]|nr:hypothetical protein [Methanimicrococcus sp.]
MAEDVENSAISFPRDKCEGCIKDTSLSRREFIAYQKTASSKRSKAVRHSLKNSGVTFFIGVTDPAKSFLKIKFRLHRHTNKNNK